MQDYRQKSHQKQKQKEKQRQKQKQKITQKQINFKLKHPLLQIHNNQKRNCRTPSIQNNNLNNSNNNNNSNSNHNHYYQTHNRKKFTLTQHTNYNFTLNKRKQSAYQYQFNTAPRKNVSLPKYLPLTSSSQNQLYNTNPYNYPNKPFKHRNIHIDYKAVGNNNNHIRTQNSQRKNSRQSRDNKDNFRNSSQSHYSKRVIQHKQIDLSTVMNQDGKQLAIIFQTGKKQYKKGNIQQALTYFKQIQNIVGGLSLQNYFRIGQCYFDVEKYNQAIKFLSQVIEKIKNSTVQQSIQQQITLKAYLNLVQCYKKSNNYLCAISMLDKCIKNTNTNPKSQIYLQRARLNVIIKNYKEALNDYKLCLDIDNNNIQAQIQKCDMIYHTQSLKKAIIAYNQVLFNTHDQNDKLFLIYRKSLLFVQEKMYNDATKCLQLLGQEKFPRFQSQVNYYKGIIKSIDGDYQSALLYFQKAVNSATSNKFIEQAYFQKIMLLMKKKDYYGAQYQLQRIPQEYLNQKIKKIRKFLDGIIMILKMNIKAGIKHLNESKPPQGFDTISKSFKAYGYFCIRQFNKSLNQINSVQGKLCHANIYNQLTLQAIIALSSKNFVKCINLLQKAQNHDPSNNNINILKAINYIQLYKSDRNKNDKQILLTIEQLLIKAAKFQPQSDFLPYILSVINYEVGSYQTGLDYIRTAIDISQDHMIKHYYTKGHLKMAQNMFAQAINDFSNAIIVAKDLQKQQNNKNKIISISITNDNQDSLQEKQNQIDQCYLYRAVCFIKIGMRSNADQDLRQFFSKIQNLEKYQKYLYYFMHIGSAEVLLSLYNKIIKTHNQETKKNKMKCLFLTKQLNSCLLIMKQLCEETQDQKIEFDYHCLYSLKQANTYDSINQKKAIQIILDLAQLSLNDGVQGYIFTLADCYFYIGVMYFQLADYNRSRQYFIKSKTLKIQSKKLHSLTGQIQLQQTYQNTIYSRQEIQYNIGISYLMSGYVVNASQILSKYQDFQEILKQSQKKKEQKKINLSPKLSQDEKDITQITPFLVYNRLCSIFEPIIIGNKSFRLSFCLPQIPLQPVKYQFCKDLLDSISLKDIPMRPNAPWIKKTGKGIVFTDNLIKQSIDLKSQRTKKISLKDQFGNQMINKKGKQKKDVQKIDHTSKKKQIFGK